MRRSFRCDVITCFLLNSVLLPGSTLSRRLRQMSQFSDPSNRAYKGQAMGRFLGVAALVVTLAGCATLDDLGSGGDEVNSCTRALRDQREFCRSFNDRDRSKNLYRCLESRRRTERECALSN